MIPSRIDPPFVYPLCLSSVERTSLRLLLIFSLVSCFAASPEEADRTESPRLSRLTRLRSVYTPEGGEEFRAFVHSVESLGQNMESIRLTVAKLSPRQFLETGTPVFHPFPGSASLEIVFPTPV